MSRVEDKAAGPTVDEADADWLPLPELIGDWGPGQKLAYAVLVELTEATGSQIADVAGMSSGTVYPALHKLEEAGWAERRVALGGNREYWTLTDAAGGDEA